MSNLVMRPPKYALPSKVEKTTDFAPTDERELARLCKKYSFPIIANLAREVPHPRRGPRSRNNPLIPIPPLKLSDMKELMRLVGKFGADFVAKAAKVIAPSRIGRPSRGDLPMLERINFAEWIQDTAEDYRRAGSKKPFRDAEIDAYEMEKGNDRAGVVPESSLRTIKRKRIQGRKELNVVLEGAKRRVRSLSRRKKRI